MNVKPKEEKGRKCASLSIGRKQSQSTPPLSPHPPPSPTPPGVHPQPITAGELDLIPRRVGEEGRRGKGRRKAWRKGEGGGLTDLTQIPVDGPTDL